MITPPAVSLIVGRPPEWFMTILYALVTYSSESRLVPVLCNLVGWLTAAPGNVRAHH